LKPLYISDLDGTLLNHDAELSQYTIETINSIIQQGHHFSIATARTAASVTKILEPLSIHVPIILMNGVLIYDLSAKNYIVIHYLTKESFTAVLNIIMTHNLTGFLYQIKENTLFTYYERLDTEYMKDFHDERVRKYQKPFTQVSDFSSVDPECSVYLSLMDTKKNLDSVNQLLKTLPDIATAFYKDIYSNDDIWYLEIFSVKATKYNAVKYLKAQYHYDYVVGFGDNLNDLPLFQACEETCAVANAKDELKAVSSHIINSNLDNGVAEWLKKNVMSHTYFYQTPVGNIGITEKNSAITDAFFCSDVQPDDIYLDETPLLKEAGRQLEEYFTGTRKDFSLPLSPDGTEFQKKVWKVLQEIPYGDTWSYKHVAEAVGNPKACRAVGMANNKNPIAIFIPCHRVIGANGKLVGYGGGLDKKEILLNLEIKYKERD
jgi:Cof subfamily protein (haloacid dehalogenase superfamily)